MRPYFDDRATAAALVRSALDDVCASSRPIDPTVTVRIGTSGWSYDHWTDVLYPPELAPARRLSRYIEEFDTVELNASFYRWPKDSTFAGWREQLPCRQGCLAVLQQ